MIPKFRAWDKLNNQMLTVTGIIFESQWNPMISNRIDGVNDKGECYCLSFNDIDLLQNTGRKDINGNEIYCSDILKVSNSIDNLKFPDMSVVDWSKEGNCFLGIFDPCEIIGTIYQNPEILKPEQGEGE